MAVANQSSLSWDSEATQRAFQTYLELLRKWSSRINLVAPSTLDDAERRHIQDSLQLLPFVSPATRIWADLGSGAGFPGLAIAIAAREVYPELSVHLVESDQRKAAFLRTVSRETDVAVTIHPERTELLPPIGADIVSARALAPLPQLLKMVHRHLAPGGLALLPKGKSYRQELTDAQTLWRFTTEVVPSETAPGSVILRIGELHHV